jgi:hypothetical protein
MKRERALWNPQVLAKLSAGVWRDIQSPALSITPGTPSLRHRKYGNRPEKIDGITFDSQLEAKRYGELKLLLTAGQIQDLRIHHPWMLHVNGEKLGYYESDFDYLENGQRVIEDTKGIETTLYRWKRKHLFLEYGIHIRDIKA